MDIHLCSINFLINQFFLYHFYKRKYSCFKFLQHLIQNIQLLKNSKHKKEIQNVNCWNVKVGVAFFFALAALKFRSLAFRWYAVVDGKYGVAHSYHKGWFLTHRPWKYSRKGFPSSPFNLKLYDWTVLNILTMLPFVQTIARLLSDKCFHFLVRHLQTSQTAQLKTALRNI